MALLDSILGWMRRGGGSKALVPAASQPTGYAALWNVFDASPGVDQANILLAYQVSLWTQRCIEAVSQNAAAVKYQLFDKRTDDEVEQHPMLALLDFVNERDDRTWLFGSTVGYTLLTGDAYWLLDRAKAPQAIWPLRPDRVTIKAARDGTPYYEYRAGGASEPVRYETDVVIHFRRWNPVSDWYGQGAVAAAVTAVNLDKAIREFNNSWIRNAAVPAGILTAEGDPPEKVRTEAREQWQRAFGGSKNAGKTPFFGGGIKWQQLGLSAKDGSYIELAKLVREEILATFGVPPVVVGLLEYASYANAREQKRLFWGDTVLDNHVAAILSRLNQDLVGRWGGPAAAQRLELRADRSKIDALQEDENERAARYEKMTGGMPWKSINEVRALEGAEAVPGGDTIYAVYTRVPLEMLESGVGVPGGGGVAPAQATPAAPSTPPPAPATPPGKRLYLPPLHIKGRREPGSGIGRYGEYGSAEHVRAWSKWDGELEELVRPFQREVARLNGEMLDEVIRNLRGQERAWGLSKATVLQPDAVLFDVDEWGRVFVKELLPWVSAAYELGGNQALAAIGAGAFDVERPEVQEFMRAKTLQIKTLPVTMHEDIRAMLVASTQEGVGTAEMARRLQDMRPDYETWKAERVARTESASADNAGAVECYRQSDVEKKEWMSVLDEATREPPKSNFNHWRANGEVVAVDKPFKDTGEELMHPSDPNGSAGNIINCRCSMLPAE